MMLDRRDRPLLTAKLTIPPSYARIVVPRLHLYHKLDEAADYPFVLISAPAGFGKTTLLSDWLQRPHRQSRLLAWLTLERHDNDFLRFWSYFITALEKLDLPLTAFIPPSLSCESEEMWIMLINTLTELSIDIMLVLDDYHVITSEAIHRFVAFLLAHSPPHFHLVISSRTDPPLPLVQMRAQGQMAELRTMDLRFTLDETMALFCQMIGFLVPREVIRLLHANTEGWIAALQLAAFDLKNCNASFGKNILISPYIGSNRYIINYFVEEVLAGLPEHVQAFLLATSILQRMNAELCNVVTERTDSETILEWLYHSNLFIYSDYEMDGWYRYHHLFGHFLHSRAQQAHPDLLLLFHLRASSWYEEHNLPIDAIDHAIAASAFERVALLVEKHASSFLRQGHVGIVYTWLKQLQERGVIATHPWLVYLYACNYLHTDRLVEYEQALRQAEQCWQDCRQMDMISNIKNSRAYAAILHNNGSLAMEYIQQALELAPVRSSLAGISQVLLGASYLACGDLLQAHVALLHGQQNCQCDRDAVLPSVGAFYLGDLYLYQGRLQEAISDYQLAMQRFDEYMPWYPIIAHCRLGEIYCEMNTISSAEKHLRQAMQLADDIASHWMLPWVPLLAARVAWRHGEKELALQWLDKADLDARRLGNCVISVYTLALRVQYLLADGQVDAAHYWWEHYKYSRFSDEILSSLLAADMWSVTHARLLIAQGQPAFAVLEERRSLAQKQGRVHSEIAMLVLQARAYEVAGDARSGKQVLERALFLGEPSAYRNVFIDEGNAIAALLLRMYDRRKKHYSQAQNNSIFTYMCTLLTGFGYHIDMGDCNGNAPCKQINESLLAAIPATRQMIDPLSEREREVLRLIAEGHSNQQIAQRLVVAESTIKTHLNNIYAKLNVNSRLQALTRAYTYGLLQ